MGNKPARSGVDDDTPCCDLPVVDLALEAAKQRLLLAMLAAHPRLSHDETALPPKGPDLCFQVIRRVAEAMPLVWAGRYSGTWAMVGKDEDQQSKGAEIAGLTGQGPTTDEKQYCYGVTIDTTLFEVRRQSPRDIAHIVGCIDWKLLRAPRSAPMKLSTRIGESALEHVRGSLTPHICHGYSGDSDSRWQRGEHMPSRLELTGHVSSDPTLIGVDSYRLSLIASSGSDTATGTNAATSELRGVSRGARGNWDAELLLKRVAVPVNQDMDGFFTAIG